MAFPTPQDFVSNHKFDYIIIGGGTAGLAVAARLSEDPTITVGVVEAGGYHPDEPLINVPGYFGRSLGNPSFDWAYLTVPQEHANGRPIFHPRGKLLGGSSALNFMALGRATKEEYDAFELLGNDGWNWAEFTKYIKRSETSIASSPEVAEKYNAKLQEEFHGTSGPLVSSHSPWISDLSVPLFAALDSLGVKPNPDSANGTNTGSYTVQASIDPKTAQRSYSASAYYAPNADRPNLVVLINAQVTKIVLEAGVSGDTLTATAVEFTSGGESFSVPVTKEVILSAGSFQTPQLLELSGIGDKTILDSVGIPVKLDLPGVGANLQDHIYISSTYEVKPELETFDVLRDEARSAQEELNYQAQKGPLASVHSAFAFLPLKAFASAEDISRLQTVLNEDTSFEGSSGLKKQHTLLKEWFNDDRHAQAELITYPGFFPAPGKTPTPGSHYNSLLIALTHPVSRGSVHITSADPLARPAIDPKYLSSEVDLEVLTNGVKFVRKLHDTEPLKSLTVGFLEPAWGEGTWGETEVKEYVKNGLQPVYHPIGTAAMLSREDGGVVDSGLKVHGTANLRVVDASVFPLHIAAHPQSTIYGLAEKAADLIKSAWKV